MKRKYSYFDGKKQTEREYSYISFRYIAAVLSTLFEVRVSLLINIIYGIYNIVVGVIMPSWWFLTAGAYYLILSIVRYFILRAQKNSINNFLKPFAGIMLMVLSVPLSGMVVLASVEDRGKDFHEIIMITIALYTFTKLTLAIINLVKSKRNTPERVKVLRNISFADAFVAIFSLQRSMLVSFAGMPAKDIRIMNIATGSAVCVIIFLLGLNLVLKKRFKPDNKE